MGLWEDAIKPHPDHSRTPSMTYSAGGEVLSPLRAMAGCVRVGEGDKNEQVTFQQPRTDLVTQERTQEQ